MSADSLTALGWLVGWTLVVLTGIAVVAGVVHLVRRGTASRVEVGLLVVGSAALVVVVLAHPLWGSGSGSA